MTTEIFRISSGRLALLLFMLYGRPWAAGAGIAIAAGVIAAFLFDWRIILLVLMFMLIVLPGVLLFLYICHAFRKATVINAISHTLTLGYEYVEAGVYTRVQQEEESATDARPDDRAAESPESKPEEEARQTEELCVRRVRFPLDNLSRIIPAGSDSVLLMFDRKVCDGWLWVPASAFADAAEYERFLKIKDWKSGAGLSGTPKTEY